jgi:AcrR family transcriptional regulator
MRKTRKEQRHEITRDQILEAAARAFAAGGLQGTSMESIASEAGFATSSLYRYFPSKQELYRDLVVSVTATVLEPFRDPLLPALGFRDRLEFLLRRQFSAVEQHRDFFVMFGSDRTTRDRQIGHAAGEPARSALNDCINAFEVFLDSGVSDGYLRKLETREIAYLVTGLLEATIFRWTAGDLPRSLQDQVPILLDLILRGIEAERKP